MSSWEHRAACVGTDPELFFSPGEEQRRRETNPAGRDARVAAAKEICTTCPVTAECLEKALRTRSDYGVWAELDANERATLRAQKHHGKATR